MRERLRFCPRTPLWAFGVSRKTLWPLRPASCPERGKSHTRSGAPWLRQTWRGPNQNGPLPEPVSRPVARCIARARDGDGGGVQECRRPNARNFAPAGARPKGRAGPSATISTGPLHLVGPALAVCPPMIGISVARMANVDNRRAGGGDDHDRHQGAIPEDMVC